MKDLFRCSARTNRIIPFMLYGIFAIWIIIIFTACNNNDGSKITYIEKDTNDLSPKSISIADASEVYPYSNTNEGYESAGKELKNPIIKSKENLLRGEKLYLGHCKHCHGVKGNAEAPMIIKEKYPPPPKFKKRLKKINEGKMFHSITYGKNLMPSNLKELNTEEKWLLVNYIQNMAQ